MPFYAVKAGKVPGIYTTWDQCKQNVSGFKAAVYRKFNTVEEASAFVFDGSERKNASENPLPVINLEPVQPAVIQKYCTCLCTCGAFPGSSLSVVHQFQDIVPNLSGKRPSEENEASKLKRMKFADSLVPQPVNKDSVVIYTDGACVSNGRKRAKGGIGVYWGPNHPMNISETLEGRQTNNRAEIMAAVRALNQCKSIGIKNVKLCTDSNFLIKGITQWINKWKRNGWKLATGGDVINREDFELLDQAQKGLNVNWEHVRGHKGIPGNEAADKLARDGVV